MTTTLYGIKNCDTVRKARRWLDDHNVDYQFHDVREQALTAEQLRNWLQELGDSLINKRSTTWKQLSDEQRRTIDDDASAVQLLLQHPTLMKRPLLDTGSARQLGFKAEHYEQLFTHHTL
ncbi:MAG: ArsC family reductase [Spongiibacter marinus]|uniref:ArsC family reductase n=1 Tax=Spongiibacter marinus TaxID=354246 RepID=UPI003C6A7D1D